MMNTIRSTCPSLSAHTGRDELQSIVSGGLLVHHHERLDQIHAPIPLLIDPSLSSISPVLIRWVATPRTQSYISINFHFLDY